MVLSRLSKLFFEEQKYELANVMGSEFSPKVHSNDITLSIKKLCFSSSFIYLFCFTSCIKFIMGFNMRCYSTFNNLQAAELAAAIIGPQIGASSYILY